MKKPLLFTTGILITGMLGAQVASKKAAKIPANLANTAMLRNKNVSDNNPGTLSVEVKEKIAKSKRVSATSSTVIGNSYYDLQSNSSVADRVFVNQDGTIGAVWTMEPVAGNTAYPNRGTGYAYFDGSAWSAAPTARIENVRVGWGNIVQTRTGKEIVISHGANSAGKMNMASRPAKGTGAWTNNINAVATATTGGNFWPRMVTASAGGSDTIYTIALTYPTAQGGATYQGLDGAVVFSRSTNGGTSWDINNAVPTGLDTSRFRGFGGDAYAIAARGPIVAVLAGDSDRDLTLSKSTDGGVTWTKTTVLKFPIKKWDYTTQTTDINNDGTADTLETNDGTFALGLDNNGMAYAFYGAMRILNTTPSASGYNYFPYTDGLMMWNETMAADAGGVLVAEIEDLGGDGVINLPTPSVATDLPFGRFGNSLTSFPSVAFDAQNNMYLSYASIVDGLVSLSNSEKVLRHTYIVKSCDGGVNWTAPMDLVGSPGGIDYEGVYGSMAKTVNGSVHIVFQRDLFCGFGVPPTSGTSPDAENIDGENEFVYVNIPTVDLTCTSVTGIKDASSVASLSFYPNPASTSGTIEVNLKENAKMEITVMNSVGQTVFATSVNGNAGSNKVDVSLSNLSSGIYFYQVKIANNKTITNKFVVGK
jgi:hypothetical protein